MNENRDTEVLKMRKGGKMELDKAIKRENNKKLDRNTRIKNKSKE